MALIACVLSLVLAPAAVAEPVEGEPSGTTTTKVEPAPGWEHNKSYLEYLDRRQAASNFQPTPGWEHNKSYLEYLDRQRAAAASGGEPAVETSADDSGQPWLVGAGVAAAVAIASIALAIVRSRRQTTTAPVQRERDRVNT